MSHQIRVLLLDDEAVVRMGVKFLLESHPNFAVVGEASTSAEAIMAARHQQPDIILLELLTDGGEGLDYIAELSSTSNQPRLVVLTRSNDQELHLRAIDLGVMGLVSKKKDPGTLLKALEKVYEGEVWLDRCTIAKVLSRRPIPSQSPERLKINSLTKREHNIIALVAQGMKNKQVAEKLAISDITVRHHLTSIFNKLDVADRFELIIYAYTHGLCDLPDSRENVASLHDEIKAIHQ